MYWQWANAYLTETVGAPSVALLSKAVAGYFEISYFHTAYFNTVASAANVDIFKTVKLYANDIIPGVNYEHLFMTYDPSLGPGSDPLPNSLFDLNNFQQLVSLGMSTANILTSPDMTYDQDFSLNDDWYYLMIALQLDSIQ